MKEKIIKIIQIIIVITLWIIIIVSINSVRDEVKSMVNFREGIEKSDQMLEEQNEKYKEYLNKELCEINKPYEIEGFTYLEGDIDTGYAIIDENGNEFVWVPCMFADTERIVKLEKSNFVKEVFVSYSECYDDINYNDFFESIYKNNGFYISRYEIGKEDGNPVSKKNVEMFDNVNYLDAKEIAGLMYNHINSEVINGYAYDTTIRWIQENNEIGSIVPREKANGKFLTGGKSYNNIYDIFDDVGEISSERYFEKTIYRIGYSDKKEEGVKIEEYIDEFNVMGTRMIIEDSDSYPGIGFRIILYK